MTAPLTVFCIAGARPNFIKLAPLIASLDDHQAFDAKILHTGQHYDDRMSRVFFDELGIRDPDIHLESGAGSHAVQTARIMTGIDEETDRLRPDIILVVGDVNSTLAAALVAKKKNIRIVHVEAGLRSGDELMPEEINRILTDRLSDALYTTEEGARDNLLREGIEDARICFAGNVMIDSLVRCRPRAIPADDTMAANDASERMRERARDGYVVTTLHRPANVDNPAALKELLEAIIEISASLPVIFPAHPRTAKLMEQAGYSDSLLRGKDILVIEPVGYLAMLGLMKDARLVLTDSGGLQEETTGLGVPCLTARPSTERPITVEQGTNTIVGTSGAAIIAAFRDVMATGGKAGRIPPLWDGKAAIRIVEDMAARFARPAR